MNSPRAIVGLLATLGLIVVLATTFAAGSGYAMRVMSVAGIFAILAIGYQLIFGHAGALSLAQGSFMGIGAYVSAILAARFGWGFDAALPFSVAVPVLAAWATGAAVLRLHTHYFALATLILSQLALLTATQWESLTGGANGIGDIPPLSLLGMPIRGGWPTLATVWAFVALSALAAWWVMGGRRGAAHALMRSNQPAAWSVGIDTGRLRLTAFVLSAGYAGLAGSLSVHVIRVVSPEILQFPIMVSCLTIAVVGSRRRVVGAIAASVLIVGLPEWTRALRETYLLVYGVILLLVVILAPEGLMVAAERLAARLLPTRPAANLAKAAAPPAMLARPGALLEVSNVSRSFGGVRALAGASLTVRAGEVVGLIGPNGSGKTTLLNAVSGLSPAQSGRIVFEGQDIEGRLPHLIARGGLGRSFQVAALVDDLTAVENVGVACDPGLAMGLLELLGAGSAAVSLCGSLPTVMRRRVEIARALSLQPRLLMLDEPAAGLSESEQDDLASRLRAVASRGIALLIVEHDMAFLAKLTDRLVCLASGRVISEGAPSVVLADPGVIAAYLGEPLR